MNPVRNPRIDSKTYISQFELRSLEGPKARIHQEPRTSNEFEGKRWKGLRTHYLDATWLKSDKSRISRNKRDLWRYCELGQAQKKGPSPTYQILRIKSYQDKDSLEKPIKGVFHLIIHSFGTTHKFWRRREEGRRGRLKSDILLRVLPFQASAALEPPEDLCRFKHLLPWSLLESDASSICYLEAYWSSSDQADISPADLIKTSSRSSAQISRIFQDFHPSSSSDRIRGPSFACDLEIGPAQIFIR